MSIELDPAELGFKRPYTHEVAQTLILRNPLDEPLAFKVKTTAPKQYCVRPNSGKIDPGEQVEISVILQPMREDPAPDARCRDKFLVQSVRIPPGSEAPSWGQLEQSYKAQVQERKIRVHYLPADGSAPVTNGYDDTTVADESAIMMSPPASHPARSEDGTTHDARQVQSSPTPADESLTHDQLLERLAEANAEIERLKRENNEGLRRRKEESSRPAPAAMALETTSTHGLSVQTAFILCLLVFIITWLLF